MSESREPKCSFSRRQLYEMVWKEPVEDVAKHFGLSGRGLGKLCERNSIPVPPRGYWQRKAAGQRMERRPPLIDLPGERFPDLGLRITKAASNSAQQPREQSGKTEIVELYQREAAVKRNIKVPKTLRSLHRIPAKWVNNTPYSVSLLEKKRPLLSRTCKIFSGILSFAEIAGFKVADYPAPASTLCVLSYQNTRVAIKISERITHTRRRLTADEKAAAPFWDTREWQQTKDPTGELVLTVNPESFLQGAVGFPTTWSDDAAGILETKLTAVFAGMVATVAAIQHDAAVALAKEQEAQRRAMAAQARQQEREKAEERKAKLRRDALAWREAVDLRAFVAAVQSAGEDRIAALPVPLEEWVRWSLAVADEIDPLL